MASHNLQQALAHRPVLLAEVLNVLSPKDGETLVDGTFGNGGYTSSILQAADCRVIAFDRDPSAVADGMTLVQRFAPRLNLVHERFSRMGVILAAMGISSVSGIVLDVGVSSMQIDQPERGFSFLKDGPLDMRMSNEGVSAADVVNTLSAEALADIFYLLGEEKRSRAIAAAIIAERQTKPFRTTFDLVRAIERVTGPKRPMDRIHPATRSFQALRIYVNAELDELDDALHLAEQMLLPGGRLVVVSFHSLEDRMVKKFLVERSGRAPGGSRHQPAPARPPASFQSLGHGVTEASEAEITANPRARSAKLRAAVRTAAEPWPRAQRTFKLPQTGRAA